MSLISINPIHIPNSPEENPPIQKTPTSIMKVALPVFLTLAALTLTLGLLIVTGPLALPLYVGIIALAVAAVSLLILIGIGTYAYHTNQAAIAAANEEAKIVHEHLILQVAEAKELEQRVELKKLLHDKKIVVRTMGLGGFGDFLCAKKICLYLHDKLGIPWTNIALASTVNDGQKKILHHDGLVIMSDQPSDVFSWNPDIQIFAPVADQFYLTRSMSRKLPIPTLAITEYGFANPQYSVRLDNTSTCSFGLDENSLGYIPTPEIREWAKIKEKASPGEKLQKLASLPKAFQEAILGQPYSPEAIEKFTKESKLYFGYASEISEIYSFLFAVSKMNQALKDSSDLCFYFMGDVAESMEFDLTYEFIEGSKKSLQIKLVSCGIGGIDFIDMKGVVRSKTFESHSTKRIKVICGYIDSQHVPALHMASEEETLLTGDQTLSEGLSAEKFPVYEVRNHKECLYQQFVKALPDQLKIDADFYNTGKSSILNRRIDDNKLSQFFIRARTDAKISLLVKTFMKNIAHKLDFAPRFDRAMLRLMQNAKDFKRETIPTLAIPDDISLVDQKIPFNTKVFISEHDMGKLCIWEDGYSKHSELENSHFLSERVLEGYEITRKRRIA